MCVPSLSWLIDHFQYAMPFYAAEWPKVIRRFLAHLKVVLAVPAAHPRREEPVEAERCRGHPGVRDQAKRDQRTTLQA